MAQDAEVLAMLAQDQEKYTDLQLAFMRRLPYLTSLLNTHVERTTGGQLKKWDVCQEWYDDIRFKFVDGYERVSLSTAHLSDMETAFLDGEKSRINAAWAAQQQNIAARQRRQRNPYGAPRHVITQQRDTATTTFRQPSSQYTPRRPTAPPTRIREEYQQIMSESTGGKHG